MMGIFVIETETANVEYKEMEPYKSFLEKFAKSESEDNNFESIYIDLEECCSGDKQAFVLDPMYFSDSGITLSYHRILSVNKETDKYLIGLKLKFSFNECFEETIINGLQEIENKKKFIYIPKVEESQLSYNIGHKSVSLEIFVVTSKKEDLKEISLYLLSIVITLFAKGW